MNKIIFLSAFSLAGFLSFAQSSSLTRNNDPVIISGTSLPDLSTLTPSEIVGFKYASGNWTQVPVQVDERALLDIVTPYGPLAGTGLGFLPPAPSPSNPKIYLYCDAATNVGVDATSTFDGDDELSFMAKDAGGKFNGTSYPTGVASNLCYQVMVLDTVLHDTGYVYLFKSSGTLLPGAGVNYVNNTSDLAGTSGFPANNNMKNTENTTISTVSYAWHFISEWVVDELKIIAGNGVDILDRHKAFFANGAGGCARHEELFASGENAFVVCKTGPVRVIRSYMGAQSGPLTQRTHFFYENRHDILTDLRVHYIPSIYDVFDYNPNATGMIYRNNLNTTGVTVDGNPDAVAVAGSPDWEHLSGVQGSLSILNRVTTTLGASTGTLLGYYDDNTAAPASNCTGVQGAWGTSGVGALFANNVCTDCYTSTNYHSLQTRRTIYFGTPNLPYSTAVQYSEQMDKPLELVIARHQLIATGFSEQELLKNVALFPNPSEGFINISGIDGKSASIAVYNSYGQLVQRIDNARELKGFSIREQGIYEIVISTEKGSKTHKVVVIK
jgi:hypothetical protein